MKALSEDDLDIEIPDSSKMLISADSCIEIEKNNKNDEDIDLVNQDQNDEEEIL